MDPLLPRSSIISSPSQGSEQEVENTLLIDRVFNWLAPFIDGLVHLLNQSQDLLDHIFCLSDQWFSAARVVFERIIFEPAFNPLSLSFQQQLHVIDSQVPVLEKQIEDLSELCAKKGSFFRDIQRLHDTVLHVSRYYKQIKYYSDALSGRQERFPVQDQLDLLNCKISDLYCRTRNFLTQPERCEGRVETKIDATIQKFYDIASLVLSDNMELDTASSTLLQKSWHYLRNIKEEIDIDNRYSCLNLMSDIDELLSKSSRSFLTTTPAGAPISLKNEGNTCYLASAMQAVLCIDSFKEALSNPALQKAEENSEFTPEERILRAQQEEIVRAQIVKLIAAMQAPKKQKLVEPTALELALNWMDRDSRCNFYSIGGLRKVIFDSRLHGDLREIKNASGRLINFLTDQQDAAAVLQLLARSFLSQCCQFKMQRYVETPEIPGALFPTGGSEGREEEHNILTLNFPDSSECDLQADSKSVALNDLIELYFSKKSPKDGYAREFNLSQAIETGGGIEGSREVSRQIVVTENYKEWEQLTAQPSVLMIQLQRGTHDLRKDSRKVDLPSNGVIDLTPYCRDTSKQARYKIKSIVIHHGDGSLQSGHYTAKVERDGVYYDCNDSSIKEIDSQDFLKAQDAYLILLEKI